MAEGVRCLLRKPLNPAGTANVMDSSKLASEWHGHMSSGHFFRERLASESFCSPPPCSVEEGKARRAPRVSSVRIARDPTSASHLSGQEVVGTSGFVRQSIYRLVACTNTTTLWQLRSCRLPSPATNRRASPLFLFSLSLLSSSIVQCRAPRCAQLATHNT